MGIYSIELKDTNFQLKYYRVIFSHKLHKRIYEKSCFLQNMPIVCGFSQMVFDILSTKVLKIWLNPAIKNQGAPSFSPRQWNNMAALTSDRPY